VGEYSEGKIPYIRKSRQNPYAKKPIGANPCCHHRDKNTTNFKKIQNTSFGRKNGNEVRAVFIKIKKGRGRGQGGSQSGKCLWQCEDNTHLWE